jgi:hypothetical protein
LALAMIGFIAFIKGRYDISIVLNPSLLCATYFLIINIWKESPSISMVSAILFIHSQ